MTTQHPQDTALEEEPTEVSSPFQHRAFRWYYTGTTVSLVGSSMAPTALALAVLSITKSPTDLGFVLAARTIPTVVFILLGGVVADRFPWDRVLRTSNLGAAMTQAVVAALLISGHYNLVLISVLEFGNGILVAFTTPAMRGVVPQLVERPQVKCANSALSSSRSATRILGPTVAGLLVVSLGGGWAIAIDAASFVVAAYCMARLVLPPIPAKSSDSILTRLREGWTFFSSTRWIMVTVVTLAVTNFLVAGVWNIVGPTIALQTIGAASWGVVLSAKAAGILVMSLVMYRVTVRHLQAFAQVFMVLGSAPLLALGLHADVYVLAATAFLAGVGSGVFGPAWDTSLQENVPGTMISRVAAYDDLGSFITVPIGQIAIGPIAAAAGDAHLALAGGALFLVMALLPLSMPSVRHLKHDAS
jgi:MFS family permease